MGLYGSIFESVIIIFVCSYTPVSGHDKECSAAIPKLVPHPLCDRQSLISHLNFICVFYLWHIVTLKKKNYLCLQEHFNVVITLVSEYISRITATVAIPSEVRSCSADWALKFRRVSV